MSNITFTIKLPHWYGAELIGYTPITTFWEDFSIAEKGGLKAIKDTYNNALIYANKNIKYLAELTLVINHKSIFFDELGKEGTRINTFFRTHYSNLSLSEIEEIVSFYVDKFYEIRDYVYGDDSPFSEDEISYFFKVTD